MIHGTRSTRWIHRLFKGSIFKTRHGLIDLCDTMEECWEHFSENRLLAGCIVDRCITWQCREDDETAVTMLLP
eukprot:XP_016660772.1 PREDICTED: activin receptor type-2A-like [Acyrthosiphon pisum]